jgi:hypothetical protein
MPYDIPLYPIQVVFPYTIIYTIIYPLTLLYTLLYCYRWCFLSTLRDRGGPAPPSSQVCYMYVYTVIYTQYILSYILYYHTHYTISSIHPYTSLYTHIHIYTYTHIHIYTMHHYPIHLYTIATFLILGEDVLTYKGGIPVYKKSASDVRTVNFGNLGNRDVARLNLIECESCFSVGVRTVETFFGTAPPVWNKLFVLMANLIPQVCMCVHVCMCVCVCVYVCGISISYSY